MSHSGHVVGYEPTQMDYFQVCSMRVMVAYCLGRDLKFSTCLSRDCIACSVCAHVIRMTLSFRYLCNMC
ncbi:hypothetical protein BRADI_3g19724v3 [Brachypodium distachyon]|uniref:Uncharacterized protein n=1 Tax=Brachypodium distachyon TaxID=15368 RepID=A0A2K2CYB7_BRADI|nr:hypothetical protein BRADI_3g19724v3 [Brachypodium distachyon]